MSTGHEKILQAHYRPLEWQTLVQMVAEFEMACAAGDEAILCNLLHKLVPEYKGFAVDIFSSKLVAKDTLGIGAYG